MRIGIFDSGIGGEAIAKALRQDFPEASFQVVNDRAHLPYGEKSPKELIELTNRAIQPLLTSDCDVIVIACNSATTAAIGWLRKHYPTQLFIGIEPMIKPATELTKSGVITVCATPATLASESYARLIENYATNCTVLEPDCREWAQMIEENSMNEQHIADMVNEVKAKDTDVIVLGCTHYHWIKEEIVAHAGPDIVVLEPSKAIGRRIRSLLGLL